MQNKQETATVPPVFRAADFAASRGHIVFATGPRSLLTDKPSPAHIAAWNKRVRLPPGAVADYFVDSFKKIDGMDCETTPRIIFSVKENSQRNPSMIFEVWRKGADIPGRWDASNRGSRILRANRILEASRVYGMWCGVTNDFNTAGGKVSLRNKGIGKAIQATLMPLFMAMGYRRFDLHASSMRGCNGAYIWPRFGVEVEEKTTGTMAGLDTLPGVLRKKFRSLAKSTDISASVGRRINRILDTPDPRLLARLTAIRREIDDPDNRGRTAQLADVMLRDLYIRCHFDFESAAWRRHFFSYVGVDKRQELQKHLQQWRKISRVPVPAPN